MANNKPGWKNTKTSLDELDKVERHLNWGKTLADWLSIRVYELEREEGVLCGDSNETRRQR